MNVRMTESTVPEGDESLVDWAQAGQGDFRSSPSSHESERFKSYHFPYSNGSPSSGQSMGPNGGGYDASGVNGLGVNGYPSDPPLSPAVGVSTATSTLNSSFQGDGRGGEGKSQYTSHSLTNSGGDASRTSSNARHRISPSLPYQSSFAGGLKSPTISSSTSSSQQALSPLYIMRLVYNNLRRRTVPDLIFGIVFVGCLFVFFGALGGVGYRPVEGEESRLAGLRRTAPPIANVPPPPPRVIPQQQPAHVVANPEEPRMRAAPPPPPFYRDVRKEVPKAQEIPLHVLSDDADQNAVKEDGEVNALLKKLLPEGRPAVTVVDTDSEDDGVDDHDSEAHFAAEREREELGSSGGRDRYGYDVRERVPGGESIPRGKVVEPDDSGKEELIASSPEDPRLDDEHAGHYHHKDGENIFRGRPASGGGSGGNVVGHGEDDLAGVGGHRDHSEQRIPLHFSDEEGRIEVMRKAAVRGSVGRQNENYYPSDAGREAAEPQEEEEDDGEGEDGEDQAAVRAILDLPEEGKAPYYILSDEEIEQERRWREEVEEEARQLAARRRQIGREQDYVR